VYSLAKCCACDQRKPPKQSRGGGGEEEEEEEMQCNAMQRIETATQAELHEFRKWASQNGALSRAAEMLGISRRAHAAVEET